ncbi:magnesium-dependent phosphatase-1 [Calocera viscosa TUFC12733]|uniref:Magnesium-dependent phosphatase-1 n=1 Tax=Calocera viscosa (strain TUFC12733) TaxID=1330018 RepID=A0A167RL90_CALVF|nr:magnesium-dependent phosphatase-1 [Calocera viscosa TUFC12733]
MALTFTTLPALKHIPKLIVFDLDFTLWPLWIDVHSHGGPYTYSKSTNAAIDRRGYHVQPFDDVPKVFGYIRNTLGCGIAIASRTSTPDRAAEVLRLLELEDGTKMIDHVVHPQMYPGSKMTHLRRLATLTGIPHHDMLFFDDETRNKEVEQLGVTFVLVDDEEGVTEEAFCRGLLSFERWRKELNLKADDPDTHGRRPPRHGKGRSG